ncbi:hypothetical protein M413DRAFT_12366 [Hebeloma cylindrosporum]|uniref:Uncharacterized protein n=1 Tax=Hebeloma cylindrosporum TaxID=76867 RepID=A0A0C3BQW0_HEBCY|nr:hypothetical protein M413DRAFT_12366 [Hebeloma cylindrosporum h7]
MSAQGIFTVTDKLVEIPTADAPTIPLSDVPSDVPPEDDDERSSDEEDVPILRVLLSPDEVKKSSNRVQVVARTSNDVGHGYGFSGVWHVADDLSNPPGLARAHARNEQTPVSRRLFSNEGTCPHPSLEGRGNVVAVQNTVLRWSLEKGDFQ